MNKSAFPAAVLLLLTTALSGCPLYDDDAGCLDDSDCFGGQACDRQVGLCYPAEPRCDEPADCDANETCGRSGICMPGDCSFSRVGCVDGYECSSSSGIWQCQAASSGQGGAAGNGGQDGSGMNGGTDADGGTSVGGANGAAGAAAGAAQGGAT